MFSHHFFNSGAIGNNSKTKKVQFINSDVIDQIEQGEIHIIAIRNGKFISGSWETTVLHIHELRNNKWTLLKQLKVNGKVRDAAWTKDGDIAYTNITTSEVIIMSDVGETKYNFKMYDPQHLSLFSDGTIYLSNGKLGIMSSADNGHSWTALFRSQDNWQFVQAIRVSSNDGYQVFWTLERTRYWPLSYRRLRIYKMKSQSSNSFSDLTWRDIYPACEKHISIKLKYSSLAYDGGNYMYLVDYYSRTVHVWMINGQYHGQLQLTVDNLTRACRIVIVNEELFVGQENGEIKCFKFLQS